MYTGPFVSWDFNSIKEICDQNIFNYSQLRLSQSLFDISTNATISVLAYLVFCLFDPPPLNNGIHSMPRPLYAVLTNNPNMSVCR